ncbi:MAG: PH domain-containing protein [Candidatus Dormibacteraeota bacterium]|nr:PH domain-containing protein [Candidatus Dormibacteraeota bacterium]
MECPAPVDPADRWSRPNPRLLTLRRGQIGAGAIALLLVGGVLSFTNVALGAVLVVAALMVAGLGLVYVGRRFRSWGYLERVEDLLVHRGVMFERLSVVPYGRMQTVEVTAGPLERSLGLATVQLHTASAATDARIPGLDRSTAADLRDRLVGRGEANAEGL